MGNTNRILVALAAVVVIIGGIYVIREANEPDTVGEAIEEAADDVGDAVEDATDKN